MRRLDGGRLDMAGLVRRETAIAAVLNATISAVLCSLIFGTDGRIPLVGISAFHLDFIPHTFMTIVVGTVIPGLIARRAAMRAGVGDPLPRKRRILVFGLKRALTLTPFLLAGVYAALAMPADRELAAATAIVLKFLYGGVLAAAVTPAAVGYGAGARPVARQWAAPQMGESK